MRSDGQQIAKDRSFVSTVAVSERPPPGAPGPFALVEDVSTEVVTAGATRCGEAVEVTASPCGATPLLGVAGQGRPRVVKNAPSARLVGTITCAALRAGVGTGARPRRQGADPLPAAPRWHRLDDDGRGEARARPTTMVDRAGSLGQGAGITERAVGVGELATGCTGRRRRCAAAGRSRHSGFVLGALRGAARRRHGAHRLSGPRVRQPCAALTAALVPGRVRPSGAGGQRSE